MNSKNGPKNKKLLKLGTCGTPHGIRGGFSFFLYNTQESCLKNGLSIKLFPMGAKSTIVKQGAWYEIKNIAFGNKVICYLIDVDTRDKAESMIPFCIYVNRSMLPSPNKNNYLVSDLIGLEVRDAKTGKILGKIKDSYDNGAQAILKIQLNQPIDGMRLLDIPLIEQFVDSVNFKTKTVYINIPSYV